MSKTPPAEPGGDGKPTTFSISRRGFLKGAGAGVLATGVLGAGAVECQPEDERHRLPPSIGPGKVPVTLNINGKDYQLRIEPRVTLLNALRNELNLTGAKLVCDRGQCGACTVLVDGAPVNSCMTLAVDVQGYKIQTIEGLAAGDNLHPIQEEFVNHDALQCGFCTPGMIMATKAILDRNPKASLDEIKEGLSGNICRCGTYTRVFAAALAAGKRR